MKKALPFLIILLTIGATVESSQTERAIEENYRKLQEKRRNEQLEKMRYSKLLARVDEIKGKLSEKQKSRAFMSGGAAGVVGGMAVIGVGGYKELSDSDVEAGSILGGTLAGGATAGLTVAAMKGYKWWQVRRINAVLKKYLNASLNSLNKKQAALMLSAYDKNKEGLQFLLSRNSELKQFVNQKGVLEALAHFYFGKSNQQNVMKIKQIIK